jgi:uncharacterized membrane protein YkoI
MTRNHILPAALAAALVLSTAGGAALAAQNGQHEQRGRNGERENGAEIAAVLAARITPVDAIRAAEARVSGRAMRLGLENRNGALSYEVIVATANGPTKVNVDAASGTASPSSERVGRAGAPAPAATIGLADAVAAAEQAVGGGRATEASPVTANGQPAFDVRVAKPGEARRVTVSGADGHALMVATANGGEQEDEHDND